MNILYERIRNYNLPHNTLTLSNALVQVPLDTMSNDTSWYLV